MSKFNKEIENIFNKFKVKLNNNAPLTSPDYKGTNNYKYPYKPALLISIISEIDDVNLLFNKDIVINDKIAKRYYDILTNSETFFEFMKTLRRKNDWVELGFNRQLKNKIISNIFEMPAVKLIDDDSDFWFCDKKKKVIRMNINTTDIEILNELKGQIYIQAFKTLKKCIPDYASYTNEEILNWTDNMLILWTTQNISTSSPDYERTSRRYQHIFRKLVIDRDQKCIICCASNPTILEACHLKPYSVCENDWDRYCKENGVTMCKNHHKLFDAGLITFDENWKIKISKSMLENDDFDIMIKTFEPCYQELENQIAPLNEYLEFHRNNIFIDYQKK